jgi:hypothetical protein
MDGRSQALTLTRWVAVSWHYQRQPTLARDRDHPFEPTVRTLVIYFRGTVTTEKL